MPRPPKLRQRNNGSLFADFYDKKRSPPRKRVSIGVVVDEDLDDPSRDAPAHALRVFHDEYRDPYVRGAYDPWNPDKGKIERVTLREAADTFIERRHISENTSRTLRLTLNQFIDDFGPGEEAAPFDVSVEQVRSFLGRDSISSAYRQSLYARLNAAFNFWIDRGYMHENDNPMEGLSRPKTERSTKAFIMPSEYERLLDEIRSDFNERVRSGGRGGIQPHEVQWMLPPLMFGTATGLRPAEMRALRVQDMRYEISRVEVAPLGGETKGAGRQVPLCRMATEAARTAAIGKEPTDFLFSGSRSYQFDKRRLSRRVKHYIEEAGVGSDLSLYDVTRHTCASWLAMLGYPQPAIAEFLGHASTRTTEQYMHVAPSVFDGGSTWSDSLVEGATSLGFFEPYMVRARAV